MSGFAPATLPDHRSKRPVDVAALERIGRELLLAIGEDPNREGLLDTPGRWARWWSEFVDYKPGRTDTTFTSIETDQMIAVTGMKVWSLCEHHLLPFWANVSVGYLSGSKVLGLSKFARIANQFAHKLQIQERLGQEIADEISRVTGSADVSVVISGEHLCMTMRGVKSPAMMTTSVMRGRFLESPQTRAEFLALVGR